jgi:5-methylthioadenosine/S-adenosylhomocysteine deaminase
VVTCDGDRRVLKGDVVVRNGRILAVGPNARRRARPGSAVVDADGCAVMPGLIQTHVHLCQTLMRGMAEDLPLLAWLRHRVWPLEAAHDDRTLKASAELGLAELLRGGTTTVLDMGTTHGHDVVFDACVRFGIRAFGGKAMMDRGQGVPRGLREGTRRSLSESDRLCAAWDGAASGRIRYAYAPRFILSCSEQLVRETVERMAAGAFMHVHAAEHEEERDAVRAIHGADDVDVLAKWGMRGPRAILVHGVQLTKRQIRTVARSETRVVHCPNANLKLGSGIAPVGDMVEAGIAVGLGSDGAACNNNLDGWSEMRQAALLAKLRGGPGSFASQDALDLCTIQGARVLSIDKELGSIEPGKRADLQLVSLRSIRQAPVGNVVDTLVYATGSHCVRDVMIDGHWVVRDRTLLGRDEERIRVRAEQEARRLRARAGL